MDVAISSIGNNSNVIALIPAFCHSGGCCVDANTMNVNEAVLLLFCCDEGDVNGESAAIQSDKSSSIYSSSPLLLGRNTCRLTIIMSLFIISRIIASVPPILKVLER